MRFFLYLCYFLVLSLGISTTVHASDPALESVTAKGNRYENKLFRIRYITRSPNQIAAFYEARGFPVYAINEVRKFCFVTFGVGNKSDQKLYHDLNQWQFTNADGPVKRVLRPDWKARWNELGLEKRFQSTFRWTLMPEKLDFYPQEGEGGNLIFPRTGKPLTITAHIRIGEGDKISLYQVTFKNVQCAIDTEQEKTPK